MHRGKEYGQDTLNRWGDIGFFLEFSGLIKLLTPNFNKVVENYQMELKVPALPKFHW
jgi:hypothetical protein